MTTTRRTRSSPPSARPRTRGAAPADTAPTDAASIAGEIAAAAQSADPAEQLRLLKLNLQTTRESLMRVSPDTLVNADHAAWTQQIYQTSLAINALRNAALNALTAEFTTALPRLASATTKLADDLAVLKEATAVIQAVGSSLDIIASIAVLLP